MKHGATGIVLAGGASRRLGRDKASLQLGGRMLLEHTAAAVFGVCEELVIAGGNRPHMSLRSISPVWVRDTPGWSGPLAGLAAGLNVASWPVALVVACDMPFLNERLLGRLLDSLDDCDAVIPTAGRPHPLHGAYSTRCLATVQALLRLGARSMSDLLSRLRVKYIPEAVCSELDPEGLSWFNLNTSDDYHRARYLWARRQDQLAAA